MRRRVRWNNVLRAAAAALIVVLVVAWPRLAPPAPPVPGPAVPLGEAPAETEDVRPREIERPRVRERERRRPVKRKRRRAVRRAAAPANDVRPNPAPGVTMEADDPQPAGDDRGAAPDEDPAQTEFGFETGD